MRTTRLTAQSWRAAAHAATQGMRHNPAHSPAWHRLADTLEWLTLNAELVEAGVPALPYPADD